MLLILAVAACGSDPVQPAACASRGGARGESFTIQALTAGTPPRDVDLTAVRGRVTLVLNVGAEMIPPAGAHVELWGAGKLLASAPVGPPGAGASADPTRAAVSLTFDSAALPNGSQTLEARLVAGSAPSGLCPATSLIMTLQQRVTISNP